MAEFLAETPPTRAALLALRDERQLVKEGYDFLDEKRLLLAAEMLRALTELETGNSRLRAAQLQAASALKNAIARHGLDELQVYPPPVPPPRLEVSPRSFLGVRLLDVHAGLPPTAPPRFRPVFPSPEAERCARAFQALTQVAGELAGVSGNLYRMMAEYRRTQRRAKALEDVILPEIESVLAEMESRLEENEQEEAIRVRLTPHYDAR